MRRLILHGSVENSFTGDAYARLVCRTPSRFAAGRVRVEFYGRLEKLLARHKLVRRETSTPREFALEVGGHLSDFALTRPAARIPSNVVDAFYYVRFGGRRLDERQTLEIQRELDRLENALVQSRRTSRGRQGRNGNRSRASQPSTT